MPPKTQREREADQRKAKLDHIEDQVNAGSLVIRKMTDEERKRFERSRKDRPAVEKTRRRRSTGPSAARPLPPAPRP